ncbi:hypothetical protein HF847_01075 [Clostridium cochlearium]|uniref:hypothetical protein n=1 Tax=Clostridium cochlearium TaxID=1494 RepID=UPI001459C41A|nr:hypothetical protein [Clostridium cochlearium]NME94601.1 hypothetical protein [Clostridium cochlearium]
MRNDEIKKYLKNNKEKKVYFIKWYIDSDDKTKESYEKECKPNSIVEYESAMKWLLEEDVQEAVKAYLKNQRTFKMLEIYDSMLKKAINGDVKSAEWVEKFFKSDFFAGDEVDEIDEYLSGIDIPALKGE